MRFSSRCECRANSRPKGYSKKKFSDTCQFLQGVRNSTSARSRFAEDNFRFLTRSPSDYRQPRGAASESVTFAPQRGAYPATAKWGPLGRTKIRGRLME